MYCYEIYAISEVSENMDMVNLYAGDRVKLTGRRAGDDALIALWYEDSEFARNIDTDIAHPKRGSERMTDDGTLFEFMLRLTETDELIGFAAIHSIEWNGRAGTLSIGIGKPEHRSQGYGSEALRLVLQYAFCELNLHRVGLEVIAYNERAIRAYKRIGFVEEGRAREYVFRDGKRYDRVSMGLLRRESEWK